MKIGKRHSRAVLTLAASVSGFLGVGLGIQAGFNAGLNHAANKVKEWADSHEPYRPIASEQYWIPATDDSRPVVYERGLNIDTPTWYFRAGLRFRFPAKDFERISKGMRDGQIP